MKASSVLLVCVLVTCSVWTVQARSLEISIDDDEEEQVDMEISMETGKLPGLCWACKWALNKVKKLTRNSTVEDIKSKLTSICDQMGRLKYVCHKFVKRHLGELIEELTTTDDVKTICINTGACKKKELLGPLFYPRDEDPQIVFNEDD